MTRLGIILVLLLMIGVAMAVSDDQAIMGGDDQTIFGMVDSDTGHFFSNISICGNSLCESDESCSSCSGDCGACAAPSAPSSGGAGAGSGIINVSNVTNVTGFVLYDVLVSINRDRYFVGEDVLASIRITNVGNIPDHDVIMDYYLLDKAENVYFRNKEQFKEVPTGLTDLQRKLSIPSNASFGQWAFVIEYQTLKQPLITAIDAFEVVEGVRFLDITLTKEEVNIIFFVAGAIGLSVVVGAVAARIKFRRNSDNKR